MAASRNANTILGFIAPNCDFKTSKVITRVYISLVRPHMQYAVQFWSLRYQKDEYELGSIQRWTTKLVLGFRDLQYEECLKR